MAIVIGEPVRVAHRPCACLYSTCDEDVLRDDRWAYGRRWLLEHDRSDFRMLRGPDRAAPAAE